MSYKPYKFFALLIVMAMLLGACAPAAAPTIVVTQAPPVVTEAPRPTDVPAPTEPPHPVEEPLDIEALFTDFVGSIADKNFNVVGAAKINEELADRSLFLLDVRDVAEIEKEGYIDGAVHITIRELLKNLDKLPGLDDPIVIYCASGHRGGMAMAALKMLGYTDVRNIGGGLGAWKKANLPVVTGSLPAPADSISTAIIADTALYTALDDYLSGMPDGYYVMPAARLSEVLVENPALTLVDVRTQAEMDSEGYIEGMIHIPFDKFMTSIDQLPADKDAQIVIYCASGHRGAMGLMALRMLGYTNVTNLGGGLGAWKNANLSVVGWVNWQATWVNYLAGLPEGYHLVRADVLNTQLVETPPFLLDVREAGELEQNGYIDGAVHIPIRNLLNNLDKLPAKDQPIVIYCASGHRGALGMVALQMLGYTNVKNLGGGLNAWKRAELPVVMGVPETPTMGEMPVVNETLLRDLNVFISGMPDSFYFVTAPNLNTELAESNPPLILDVRSQGEWDETGVIADSQLIIINDLLANMSLLPADKDAPIVVLCASGHRGAIGMMALRMLGYTNVRNLGGGLNAWVAAELPLEKN
jgi:rhodanese-related sulfurtransferase